MKLKHLALTLFTTVGFSTIALAQHVEQFVIEENSYYGTKELPEEITGRYFYEKTKEPIVEIKSDGTGYFQTHGVKTYPVEYWVQTDEKGVVQKKTAETGRNYQIVLILKYGSNGETGWRGANAGTYTRIEVTMDFDRGYAIVLGERFCKL